MQGIVMLILLMFYALIYGAIHLITRKTRKKEDEELPEWRKQMLTKEQQSIVRKQYAAYKAEVYKDYPEAAQFAKNRNRWTVFIIMVYLVTSIVRSWTEITTDVSGNVNMVVVIVGMLTNCLLGAILLFVTIENRQLTVLLYVIGLVQLVSYIQSLSALGIDSLAVFVQTHVSGFRYSPWPAMSNILSIIHTTLLLFTAVRLTVIRRNRELADLVEMLDEKINTEFEPTGI